MLAEQSRPEKGSVIVTFAGEVVETRNGLTRAQIERFLTSIEEAAAATHLRLVETTDTPVTSLP